MHLIAGLILVTLTVALLCPRDLSALDSVRFSTIRDTPLFGMPSAVSAPVRVLSPGTAVLIIGEPDVRDELVHVAVPSAGNGWVDSGNLSLDASDVGFRAELSKLRVSPVTAEPPIVRWDTVFVRLPGGRQAVEEVIVAAHAITTIRLAPFGVARPIAPPAMKNFLDGDNWMLREPLRYTLDPTGKVIEVPKGFVTDFASVPPVLHSLLGATGPYGMPAIVHDFLYWSQACSKDQADQLFRLAMGDSEVSPWLRQALFVAVRVFGGRAWRANRTERAAGLLRVVPPPDDDVPANTRWTTFRRDLKTRAVTEGAYTKPTASACALGGNPGS